MKEQIEKLDIILKENTKLSEYQHNILSNLRIDILNNKYENDIESVSDIINDILENPSYEP